jgi:tetratricopeptide (TPR) repeat protein
MRAARVSKTAESVASIAVGGAAAAFGDTGGALQAGTGIVALAGRVLAGGEAKEHARVLERVAAALAASVAAAPAAERADMRAAEAVIVQEAPALLLDRGAMAACAAGDFEAMGAAHLMEKLGLTARDFTPRALAHAEALLRAGLAAAKENEGFYRRLSLDALLDARADAAATRAMVETLLRQSVFPADARRLLENLALRFGHDNPDAPAAELEAFLREKAKDYAEMRARLDALAAADRRIANLMGAAEAALAAGDFDEADARLADAEAMQQAEHTLVQVRKQAQLRVERGRAALLKGDAAAAVAHAEAAAGFFGPFDPLEGARLRDAEATVLGRHGELFSSGGNTRAAELWSENLAVYLRTNRPADWAATQNNLGLVWSGQARRTTGPESTRLLRAAVKAYRAALAVYTRAEHPTEWAAAQNNIANLVSYRGERTSGAEGLQLLKEAVEACHAALEVRTRAKSPANWAATQNNLGIALSAQGVRTGGDEGARMLCDAIEAYVAALEVRSRTTHPVDWAITQNNLAVALYFKAVRFGGDERARLLDEAVTACRAALEVFDRAKHPFLWATTQMTVGLAMGVLGEFGDEPAWRYSAALAAVDSALEVFDPAHTPCDHAKATKARALLAGKLAALRHG